LKRDEVTDKVAGKARAIPRLPEAPLDVQHRGLHVLLDLVERVELLGDALERAGQAKAAGEGVPARQPVDDGTERAADIADGRRVR
jgi:hypothetical protein